MKSDKTTPNVPTLRFPNYNGEWQKQSWAKYALFEKAMVLRKTTFQGAELHAFCMANYTPLIKQQ